jgi:subtilisin family serine protease
VLYFADRPEAPPPSDYFHPAALERRQCEGLGYSDPAHSPPGRHYLAVTQAYADSLLLESRWLNAVLVSGTPRLLDQLCAQPFVRNWRYSPEPGPETQDAPVLAGADDEDEILADFRRNPNADSLRQVIRTTQTSILGRAELWQAGLKGQGVRMAVFDAGFPGVDESATFAALRPRIVAQRDFVLPGRKSVYSGNWHGTAVLSCIGGIEGDLPLGMAPEAEYLLARTEMSLAEGRREQLYWAAAAEWADRQGVHIINSSLGYTRPRYTPQDLDGQIGEVDAAARMAAARGLLVVNAAGNEGSKKWLRIGKPADVDSVLTVGGVTPQLVRIAFSSVGPNTRQVLKPDLVAYGLAWVDKGNRREMAGGTSFATPLVAGLAACVRQRLGAVPLATLLDTLKRLGHLYPYGDTWHGHGLPQGDKLVQRPYAGPRRVGAPESYRVSQVGDSLVVTLEQVQPRDEFGFLLFHLRDGARYHAAGIFPLQGQRRFALPLAALRITSPMTLLTWYRGRTQQVRVGE